MELKIRAGDQKDPKILTSPHIHCELVGEHYKDCLIQGFTIWHGSDMRSDQKGNAHTNYMETLVVLQMVKPQGGVVSRAMGDASTRFNYPESFNLEFDSTKSENKIKKIDIELIGKNYEISFIGDHKFLEAGYSDNIKNSGIQELSIFCDVEKNVILNYIAKGMF